ncbi:MAG: hypothetical protein PHQ32_06135 [Firmicutes bacterium]|nr:hypothetical protein [Bacillota bacterium]
MFENIDIDQSLKSAQTSLLIMILLTTANAVGILFGTGFYLPYSAFLPSAIAQFAIEYNLYILLFLILIIIGFYVGVGLIARTNPIWYIGATAFYILDTVALFFYLFFFTDFNVVKMLELIFHGWILYSLTKGSVAAYRKLI